MSSSFIGSPTSTNCRNRRLVDKRNLLRNKIKLPGVYIVPYNMIFLPTLIFFSLDFLLQNFRPLPLFPTLPYSFNIKGKKILLPLYLFPHYIHSHPHTLDIPFRSSILDILPQQPWQTSPRGIRNFIHPWKKSKLRVTLQRIKLINYKSKNCISCPLVPDMKY